LWSVRPAQSVLQLENHYQIGVNGIEGEWNVGERREGEEGTWSVVVRAADFGQANVTALLLNDGMILRGMYCVGRDFLYVWITHIICVCVWYFV
jgi:hypothetical protein